MTYQTKNKARRNQERQGRRQTIMNISGINFPRRLLEALKDNQLVVFVGAGVSIPEPAGLPTFRQLAEAVALGSGEAIRERETEDHFLGRLADRGQQVHLETAQILRQKAPKPSCLHHDLTALYPNLETLKIVTTNFDTLFEEAANARFGAQPETFRAPALPLGRDFNGIVHVHGAIDKPGDMVLTDRDFGRAYLTEGWARNFLLDLFKTFPVLFIGYGHNDTVMNYLARALPPDQTQPRFALTGGAELSKWDTLRVKPVVFPQLSEHNYTGLYEGVSRLAKYVTRGILDWQRIISEIAKNPPSLDQEEMDTVGDGLSNSARTRFFTEAASHVEWVRWLDENGHLDNLFGADSPPTMEEPTRTLGWWLARTFAKDQSDELFRIIAKHEMDIHPGFWETLAWAIGSPEHTPEQAETLTRWVSLLLDTAPPRPDTDLLLCLGERCTEAELTESLLDVFRQMSTVRTQVEERITFPQEDPGPTTTVAITQVHRQWGLNKLWEKGLKPNLNELAEPLLSQLAESFTTRHRTLKAWQAADGDWDRDSLGRSAIEPHERDAYPESIDVLIDAARDCLEYLATNQAETATAWCNLLIRSEVPLLRRLAIHASRVCHDLTPDTKIDWVIEKVGLHDRQAHHELAQIMRAVYPHAAPKQRQAIIEEVSKFDLTGHDGEEIPRIIAYQHFTWFTCLSQSDPSCDLVRDRVEEIQKQYPEFQTQEWAEFSHYHTGGLVTHISPWSADELLSKPAKEWAPKLLSFNDPDPFDVFEHERPDRIGLGNSLEEAANRNFQWGIELADTLAQSQDWVNDVWPSLMKSWARQRGEEEKHQVLDRLLQNRLQESNARAIAETLTNLIKEGNLPHNSGLLSKANQVAVTAWDNIDAKEPVGGMEDWYGRAINHPAGMLAGFWMQSLSSWYNEQPARPERISGEYLDFMDKVVNDESTAGTLGKSVMARELSFLTTVDEEWVTEHLIPLFDSEDKETRLAGWEASFYGGMSPRVAEISEKTFLSALSDIDELFPQGSKSRERFIGRFTTLVTHFVDQPLDVWIPRFFAKANEEDRMGFASSIGDNLRPLENGPQQNLWDRWLREYWENRLNGKPAMLDPSEARIMFYWLIHLQDLFPEAVELAVKTANLPSAFAPTTDLLNNLGKADSYPEATAKLLMFLADQGLPRHAWLGRQELIEKLLSQNLPEGMEHRLKEFQAELSL